MQSLLLNITAGHDILMSEFDEVSNVIVSETGKAANIIMGIILDDSMAGKIRVTINATGLDKEGKTHLIDFPGLPNIEETTEENVKIVKESDEEIKDIFARLNINKHCHKRRTKTSNK
jgi:cell division protein FtsZ